jgi:hypothetical protein
MMDYLRFFGSSGSGLLKIEDRVKHLAILTYLNFFGPVLVHYSLAKGAGDKPAQMTGLKPPSRTFIFFGERAFFLDPARLKSSFADNLTRD